MNTKVLVVTASDEPNVKKVVELLNAERVIRIDTDTLLDHSFSFWDGEHVGGWGFTVDGKMISHKEIGAVWYRRPANPKASPQLSAEHQSFAENEAQKFLRSLWSTLPRERLLWVNHPSILRELEFNKPYQAQAAVRVGLKVPETLITNNPDAAEEFFERWGGEVIIKTFGGHPLRDDEGYPQSIFTNRVSRETFGLFRKEIVYAPVMLQKRIPKRIELRITAVGEKLFSCAIYSQDSERTRDDWRRYDFEMVKHEAYKLPLDVEQKLFRFLSDIDIVFGAIDMIVTPNGEYVFLEVNPSGQWGWIERLIGLPISAALAELLSNPPPQTSSK